MIATQWKAVRVFVNNEPEQYHVSDGKWKGQTLCVCGSAEDAHRRAEMIANAVNTVEPLRDSLQALVNVATHPKCTKAQIRTIADEARRALAGQ